MLVGHHPKAFRSPASRYPKHVVRTTWVFTKKWTELEKDLDIRMLENRVAKLPDPAILSITIFKRPEDDPEPEADSEAEAEPEPKDEKRSAQLKLEAESIEHKFTHRPKNPYCKVCQKAKMLAPHARKRGGSSTIMAKKFGDHVTIDHIITRDLRDFGIEGEKVALVVKDVCTNFRYVYPSSTKDSEQVYENLLHYFQVDDDVGIIYSDNAPELEDATRKFKIRHNTSRPYADESKSVIEREIRTILEGTRANLTQAGIPEKLWPYAAQHHAMALNLSRRLDTGRIPWTERFGEDFNGRLVPFGAKVLFWNNPKQNITDASKFAPKGEDGVFLGYHIQPGFIWRQEYLVAPLKGSRDAIENDDLKVIRAKRMELPIGDVIFPLSESEVSVRRPPSLDDQNCFVQDAGCKGFQPVDDAPESPDLDDIFDSGIDLYEELAKMRKASSEVVPVPDGDEPPKDKDSKELSSDATSPAEAEATKPKPKEVAKPPPRPHDPTVMPDGTPVPKGYNFDGVRLVRNKKGSQRPPDTSSEDWHSMSAGQREADKERYQAKLRREAAAREQAERDAAPAMPVVQSAVEPHRERIASLYWQKLDAINREQHALVARVVNQAEIDRTPEAKTAMDKEWQKLVDKSCWLHTKVREYRDVVADVVSRGIKAHFGRVFEICSRKGDELPPGHPDRKWKGRSVFQGNRVSDEHNDHAIFAELGSSPASMEAAKVIDVFGSQPGYSKQQADARQAYTQALFKGIETWVRLPRNRWPKEWGTKFQDPVVPLRLALYGHPDSGGIWEKHCEDQLRTVGWVAVLPEIWQSIFYHPELDLLLVIYVDDFKMAGPTNNLAKGWKLIESVIDMDPPEPFGRYFGCNHFEKTGVKLPRSAHPFAYVFDKKTAAPARGNPRPQVREDYWEVDPELGAVVRHHVYPRKRLYVPTTGDVEQFPGLSESRFTDIDEGPIVEDDTLSPNIPKYEDWWTGRTVFPLNGTSAESIRHALAASKGKPSRSKAEAKKEAKVSQFRGTDTICQDSVPSMEKPVNVMTYDMRDFLISCVDRYCQLAKVNKQSLATVPTPFSENRVAKPLEENEPTGRLQPIASKVLMKILFAARMARWDLLRATQSLASRVTKWGKDCDAALHRLVCYINSSLDVRMQGFIGDRINECKLWLFCDADWSGEHDRKSTSGCAMYLVGPNTYYPLNAFSKKQTSITMSSTESEVVSANHGVRAQGLPSLSLWIFLWRQVEIDPANHKVRPKTPCPVKIDGVVARVDPELDEIRYGENSGGRTIANLQGLNVGLSDKFQIQFLEDNQATITIVTKGDSEKMRHTDRTQNISFGWLKQQFEVKHFNMVNVDTSEQVADVFTKPFAEKAKWLHALRLINHLDCPEVAPKKGKDSDSHLIAKPLVTAPSIGRPDIESASAQFLGAKDFGYKALQSLAELLPTKVSRRRKSKLTTSDESYYHNWGFFSFSGMQGITTIARRYPKACRYINEWIAKQARSGFTWTSFAINRDAKSILHTDCRNLRGSENFAVSFGDFKDGFLWIEGTTGAGPKTQTKANQQVVQGASHNTKDSPLYFAPHLHHCVLPWKGIRFGLIAFTSSQIGSVETTTKQELCSLGFRLPKTAAVAASARSLSRPTACNQGGHFLDPWWRVSNHDLPQQLHTLITAVRDEGGASLTKLFVGCTSLSCNNVGVVKRSLADVFELACLFSIPTLIVLCECHDESFLHDLQVHHLKLNAHVLACTGLQAEIREKLSRDCMIDRRIPAAKASHQLSTKADWILRNHDHQNRIVESKLLNLKACPCAAGLKTSPRTMATGIDRPAAPLTVYHQGDTARLEWLHSLMWCAVFGDELSQTTSEDYTSTIAAVYAEKPPQIAAQVTFAGSANSDQFPTIRKLAEVSDEGLARIQPGDSRGRERGLIVVSDSTTVFMAGKRTFCDLAPDFQELRTGNGILSHYQYLEYAPIWGAALPSIVDKVHELVGRIAQQSSRPQALAVDIIVVWMGNELVGRRGVFVDPNVPKWNQTAENMQATGIWRDVASKVCGQIQRLAALKGRPCINSVQLLGDAYPADYKLPPEYRDAVRMFLAYARGRGLKTGSLDVAVSAIPKYDGYHFREDRTHRSIFANVIAQRARCVQAEATLSGLSEENLRFLQEAYPYDRYGERVYRMKHVFDRALFNSQHSRRLLRQAEIQQTAEDCPDPWETEWVAPPEEPVTGLREVSLPADMENWAFAQQAAEERRRRELAEVTKRPRPASAEAASSSAGPEVASFDEVIAAIPYRTPDIYTTTGLRKMRAEGEAIQAAAKAAREAAAPRTGGRVMPAKEDIIGYSWDEDANLNEMLGASDVDYGAHDEEGMVILKKEDIPTMYLKEPPKWLKQPSKTLIGIVRGAIGRLPSRNGKWVLVQEVLDLLGEIKKVWIGRRYLLSIMAYDNKGRFQIAGTEKDVRSEYIDTAIWPLWIAAAHGHSSKIANEVDDNEIATCWYWDQSRSELGDAAAFQGTPIQAKGEYPPRLYHRTTRDAALAIVEGELVPGFGRSGKYHNYFAKATLDELGERGGVRANLAFEMVFDTTEVLQHAWLFETSSEGVLCREAVPGTCVLFVRDTSKNITIWSRPVPEAEAEGEEITVDAPALPSSAADPEPEFVLPEETDEELIDVAEETEAPLPAPPSGGQDAYAIEDSTAYDMEDEVPEATQDALVEANTTDAAMDAEEPSIPEMTPGDLALARGEAEAPPMPPQPEAEYLPLPAPETGGRKRACPGCGKLSEGPF